MCLQCSGNSQCFENGYGVRSYRAGLKSQLFRSLRQEFKSSLGDLVFPDSKQKKKEEGKGSQNTLNWVVESLRTWDWRVKTLFRGLPEITDPKLHSETIRNSSCRLKIRAVLRPISVKAYPQTLSRPYADSPHHIS